MDSPLVGTLEAMLNWGMWLLGLSGLYWLGAGFLPGGMLGEISLFFIFVAVSIDNVWQNDSFNDPTHKEVSSADLQ